MRAAFPVMTTNNGPKILVVAEFAPGAPGGDWVNIKQHFRGLDWGQIYWWSFSDPSDSPSREFGGRHSSCKVSPRLLPNRKWTGLKSWAIDTFVLPYAQRHLASFINSVKPDLIFLMARAWIIPLAYQVMPKAKTHWHVALYDMPDVDGMVERLGRRRTERFTLMTDTIYKNASSRSVISPAMAEEMRKRTGVECSNLFRCAVEPEAIARLREPAPKPPGDVIRIGYAGSILAESTFAHLVKAIQSIRNQLSRPVEIHLYGSQRYGNRDWFDPSLITEHGFISEAELDRHYRSGTWGVAIMHLEDVDPRYNHFSFPCKFSMSLAAGLPLICLGNPKTPLIELVRNYNVGLVSSEQSIAGLAGILLKGLEDFDRFEKYRTEILRCTETEFSAERKRQKLHELLNAARNNS
jgi:glycosyltransferase involved in cell wall biosynthesis